MYIADNYNNRIRKVTVPTGIITTYAGTGSTTYSGDNGSATSATLYSPLGVVVDASGWVFSVFFFLFLSYLFHHLGNVYIADAGNNRIRKVVGVSTDSPRYTHSYSLTHLLLLTHSLTHSLTLISMSPSAPPSLTPSLSPSAVFVITTVAGSSTSGSYSGDNGQATSAYLYDPRGVAVDSSGTSSSISYPMCLTLSPSRQRVHRRYT